MSRFDLFGNPISSPRLNGPLSEEEPSFSAEVGGLGERVEEEAAQPRRFPGLILWSAFTIGILAAQCYKLQVRFGNENKALAEGNSLRVITIQPERGLITDRDGVVLAQNSRQLALAINPETLPAAKAKRQEVYRQLKERAGISDTTIALIEEQRLSSPDTFPIKTRLTQDESLLYKEWFVDTPGIAVQEVPVRHYADLASLGQIIGYVGQVSEDDVKAGHALNERIGKTGLEKVYNQQLAGVAGKQKAEVNAYGEIVRTLPDTADSQPQPGTTLKLGLDADLQKVTAEALQHELERRTKKFGTLKDLGASAVILDPSNGVVRAMVSLPDYPANLFAKGITETEYRQLLNNPANPLLNRIIQGQYPSGSVIKPMIAAAALDAGIVTPKTSVYTPEAIYVGNFRFPDWKLHGQTDIRKAIAESNDIFFYALGGGWPEQRIAGLGIERLDAYLAKFGLGSPTGIDLPGESGGLLPTPEWKEKEVGEPWYIGDTYHSSIGQGYTLVTPLQMATSIAAVANGGTVWKPSLALAAIDPQTGQEMPLPRETLRKDFIKPADLQVVREGMVATVQYGSARPLSKLKMPSAGKTGTAEFGNKGLTHAWYVGFAPVEKPEIAFAIMIEGGGESFYSSVPVAEEILRGYFNEPLQPGQQLFTNTNDPSVAAFQGEH